MVFRNNFNSILLAPWGYPGEMEVALVLVVLLNGLMLRLVLSPISKFGWALGVQSFILSAPIGGSSALWLPLWIPLLLHPFVIGSFYILLTIS